MTGPEVIQSRQPISPILQTRASALINDLDWTRLALVMAVVALSVVLICPLLIRVLAHHDINDRPNARSSHTTVVPRGGGIAIAAGILAGAATAGPLHTAAGTVVLVGALSFATIGFVDDLSSDLPATLRLASQLLAAVATASAIVATSDGSASRSILVLTIGIVAVAGFVNAFNFMDGINGISAATTIATSATYFAVGLIESDQSLVISSTLVGASTLAFLPFNAGVARVFLGDVGSYLLGAWLILTAVAAFARGISVVALGAPLLLYVADTTATFARRLRRGASWKDAHREHAYQRLIDLGFSHQKTAALVGGTIAACGSLGMLALITPPAGQVLVAAAIATLVACYLCLPAWLTSRIHEET